MDKEIEAFDYLKEEFFGFGKLSLYGSARKRKAFINNHDFDVGLDTQIISKEFIVNAVKKFIDEWDKRFNIELHMYIYGEFSTQTFRGSKYHLMFARSWLKPIQYLRAILRKI